MGKRQRLETISLMVIFAIILLGSVLGITGYAIMAVLGTVVLWGIVSLGRHILLELGKGHWAALIYGPPVLLIIIWFGVMILTLWLHPIGWPSVLER
jgi:hypothetical protein